MDLDVIHFRSAFKVNFVKSNLKIEIIFYFVQLSSLFTNITGIHSGADFKIKDKFKKIFFKILHSYSILLTKMWTFLMKTFFFFPSDV